MTRTQPGFVQRHEKYKPSFYGSIETHIKKFRKENRKEARDPRK